MLRSLAAILSMTLLTVAPAAADPGSGTGTVVPGVTVIAPKPAPKATVVPTPAIRGFVRAHAAPSRTGQLTRWSRGVCPVTVGLSDAMNDFISQRIKAVAVEVGAPGGPCRTDVEIIFTSQPQALLDSVARRFPCCSAFIIPPS